MWTPLLPTSAPAGLATDWRTTSGTALVMIEVIPCIFKMATRFLCNFIFLLKTPVKGD